MTHAIPCSQFKGIGPYEKHKKRDEVYVDPVSVELCLDCPLPVEQCRGAPSVRGKQLSRRASCPYEQAIVARMAREYARTVTLPGPRPDGVMRKWKCEMP